MTRHSNLRLVKSSMPLLEPLDALEIALGNSIDGAWEKMSENMRASGFETTAFALGRRSVDMPFTHQDTQVWGTFVSDNFVKALHARPELQKASPALRSARLSAIPNVHFEDGLIESLEDPRIAHYAAFVKKEGIVAQAICPFHAPGEDLLMLMGWWDFTTAEKARAHWQKYGGSFALSATYYCQGILEAFGPLCEVGEKLSPRERECLLWAGAGRTTGEIADIIGIADATVDEYFSRAMRKLGASTRAQACARAIITGILKP